MRTIGQKIKELRVNSYMTQEQLGQKIGVQKSAIQKYENGLVKVNSEKVKLIAEIFDVAPSYLLGWNEKYDVQKLKQEVIYLEQLQRNNGIIGVELFKGLRTLNENGLIKVLTYIEDLNEEYRKDDAE